jgi:AcrR family transcriptional regulator
MARARAHIDTAALADAFAGDGLRGTSSATLALALGIAKPTLYVHGQSKEALFLRAVEAEVERVLDPLHAAEAATAGRSARDRAVGSAEALLAHAGARPLGARLLYSTASHRNSAVADSVEAALRRPRNRIEGALTRDLAADRLDPSRAPLYARALHGAAVALVLDGGAPQTARPILAALAAAVVPLPAAATPWPVP